MGLIVVALAFITAIGLGIFFSVQSKNKGIDTSNRSFLTDANVIKLASEKKEGISVAALCLHSNANAKDAKQKLEDLREQGILYLSIEENGTEKYLISDISLLDHKK
ncbi:hypothetical protein EI427_12585 [Flammeovirga pectinis]|uniref:Helix-turn-helix domain-containing protein n=1 Tax=Flammeovirga pectinis TaxID=2494373 RepID=A0A3Q9FPN4_9BACT|nr:hypothetical protein [Flammeovirga pectinis]AZQ63042.1 hypothetical protein EI427_12585 [Flammeovirga pectinis]